MSFDLRIPVGFMFTIFGLILAAVGAFGDPALAKVSLGINMNLYWGLAMLLFGIVFLFLAAKGKNKA